MTVGMVQATEIDKPLSSKIKVALNGCCDSHYVQGNNFEVELILSPNIKGV